MLESQRIQIVQQNRTRPPTDRFVILEASTQQVLGFVHEESTWVQRWIGWFFGLRWRTRTWLLREVTDECLVALIHRPAYFVQPLIEVQDATGVLVGLIRRDYLSWKSLWLFVDAHGQTLATVDRVRKGSETEILAGGSKLAVAKVSGERFQREVHFQEDMAGQIYLKMLILAWCINEQCEGG